MRRRMRKGTVFMEDGRMGEWEGEEGVPLGGDFDGGGKSRIFEFVGMEEGCARRVEADKELE